MQNDCIEKCGVKPKLLHLQEKVLLFGFVAANRS